MIPSLEILVQETNGRRVVCPESVGTIRELALKVQDTPGAAAELGVYRGGTARVIARCHPNRRVFLFDTFEGVPERITESLDGHNVGDFGDTSPEQVKGFLANCPNAVIYPGLFPDTVDEIVEAARFAFVHLDCDLYTSILDGISFFYPRLEVGGVILFDDYEWQPCAGVTKALHESFDPLIEIGEAELVIKRNQGGTDQAYITKLKESEPGDLEFAGTDDPSNQTLVPPEGRTLEEVTTATSEQSQADMAPQSDQVHGDVEATPESTESTTEAREGDENPKSKGGDPDALTLGETASRAGRSGGRSRAKDG